MPLAFKKTMEIYENYHADTLEFLDTCRLCGWKHICTSNGVFFFFNNTDDKPIPIYDKAIEYENIQEKKEEFRSHFSANKYSLLNTGMFVFYMYMMMTSEATKFDYFIISLFLIDIVIYFYIHYSKNIIFREKGLYI